MEATFPYLALSQAAQFHLAGQSLDPEESITGEDTIVPTMRGRWMAQASFVLRREAATLQWQAFLAQMQGRIGTTRVPVRSRYRPRDLAGVTVPFCLPELGDLAPASTTTRATLAAGAALRATQISIALGDTLGLEAGHFFSLGPRLHRVRWVDSASSAAQTLTIEPPLRAAHGTGAKVEIERPVCLMRMVTETEGLFDQVLDRMPAIQVQFREAL